MNLGNIEIEKCYLGNMELTYDNAFVGKFHIFPKQIVEYDGHDDSDIPSDWTVKTSLDE